MALILINRSGTPLKWSFRSNIIGLEMRTIAPFPASGPGERRVLRTAFGPGPRRLANFGFFAA